MSSRLAALAVAVLVAWGFSSPTNLFSADEAADANPDSRKAKASVSAETRITTALDRSVTWDFMDAPLADVAELIRATFKIDVVIDRVALEDFGIGVDTPVTFVAREMRLRSFLRHALSSLDLTFRISDDALWITTPEEEESELSVVLYPVQDLVSAADSESGIGQGREFDRLIDVITTTIQPDAWDEVGGPGSIVPVAYPPMLASSQTDGVHKQTRELMHSLRAAKRAERQGSSEPVADDSGRGIRKTTHAYPLPVDDKGKTRFPAKEVVHLIMQAVEPTSWVITIEEATFVMAVGNTVVVRNTEQVHQEVQELLQRIGAWTGRFGAFGYPGSGGGGMGGMGGGGGGGGGFFSVEPE